MNAPGLFMKTSMTGKRRSASRSGFRFGFGAAVATCLGGVGCFAQVGEDGAAPEDEVAKTELELSVLQGVNLWPDEVDVCFRNNGGYCAFRCSGSGISCTPNGPPCAGGATCSSQRKCQDGITACTYDSQCDGKTWNDGGGSPAPKMPTEFYEGQKEFVASVVDGVWGASSGLTFNVTGDCPAQPPVDDLVINLRDYGVQNGSSGFCGLGVGAHCEFGANTTNYADLGWVALHEIGHALGLPHEHQRMDAVLCEDLAARIAACDECTNDGCTPGAIGVCSCPSVDYETCFRRTARTRPNTLLTLAELYEARGVLNDGAPRADVLGLTDYDPSSVMNYCGPRPDFSSPLDKIGIQILYPSGTTLNPACAEGCWSTSEGLLLHSNGAIEDRWKARGALAWWSQLPEWREPPPLPEVNGFLLAKAATLRASQIGARTSIVFEAISKWNGKVMSGTATVKVDAAKWTALMVPLRVGR